jgi:antitoxin VapB
MALSIKNPEADRLARELAKETGESLTEVVIHSLRERLRRVKGRSAALPISEELRLIRERCASHPVLDDREPDEILGYDHRGLPR